MWLKFEKDQLPLLTRIILFFQRKKFGFDLNPTKAWGTIPRLMLGVNFLFKLELSPKNFTVLLNILLFVFLSKLKNS